jgi:uncharacterized protein (TIGR04255 family)
MSITVPKPPYPKAPIIEGVIHLGGAGIASPEELQKLVKRFAEDYPQQQAMAAAINVIVNTTGGGALTIQQQPQGYLAKSADQADIVLLFTDGVAAARLAPYPGWEHLRERASIAWAEWRRNVTGTSAPKRIGIRYVNRIDVPIKQAGIIDIDDYLRFGARMPEFSRRPMTGFLVQITRPTDLEHWSATITSTIATPPPLINHVSVVLDIDVFRTEQIPGRNPDLWDCIDAVRPLKNDIFEACITDEARKLFV